MAPCADDCGFVKSLCKRWQKNVICHFLSKISVFLVCLVQMITTRILCFQFFCFTCAFLLHSYISPTYSCVLEIHIPKSKGSEIIFLFQISIYINRFRGT